MHILRGFIYEGYNSCFMGYVPVGFVVCFTCVFFPWIVHWFSLVEWCLYISVYKMAMGGVINIVTRRPTRTGAQADLSFGMYNTGNANVGASGIINDKLSVGVNYNH